MPISAKDSKIRDWVVYKIQNPSGYEYIGITSNFKKRISSYAALRCKSQKLLYRSISKHGWDTHEVNIVDSFAANSSQAASKEMFWIRTYMSNKHKYPEMKGMNLTDGGDGTVGRKQSEEQKEMLRLINTGRKHTPEALAKISAASIRNNRGKKLSEATKEKLRQANLGKKYSEETKRKLSEIKKGKKIKSGWTEEKKRLMSEIKKGTKHTEEAKRKIGEASKGNKYNLGKKHTEERKIRMSEFMKGKKYGVGYKHTEEWKENMSKLMKGRKRSVEDRERMQKQAELRCGKKVSAYDLNGVLIKEYPSIISLCKDFGAERSVVRKKIKDGTIYQRLNIYIKKL